MSLTETQCEYIADGLRTAGFDLSDLDNDDLAKLAKVILDALNIQFTN